jgi:hypothetical protein
VLRAATNSGWALGTGRFAQQIERATRRRAAPRLPGHLRKEQRKNQRQIAVF